MSRTVPRIISVDDHVVEPPDLWTARLPRSLIDAAPRVVRGRAAVRHDGPEPVFDADVPDGEWCDWWTYDGKQMPLVKALAGIGFDRPDLELTTYDEIHPGCYDQATRLDDMTEDHLEASICYPNVVPRFCGQTFYEGSDKDLGLACIRAYNDWILDDWCGGAGHGRLLPLTLVPLWDVELAATEVHRCAEKGTVAVAFSENPHQLGLPSIHSGHWDPLFRACAEADVTLCMHIGSSSWVPKTSPDSPHIITTCTHFSVTMGSLLDFVFSGTLDRIPGLKLFFAESQAGWMPYVLEQADWLWQRREGMTMGSALPEPPSSYVTDRIFTSIYNDEAALRNRDLIGMGQLCWETDYPHSVATFPDTKDIAVAHCESAGLDDDEVHQLLRGNAIRAFGLDRLGIRA